MMAKQTEGKDIFRFMLLKKQTRQVGFLMVVFLSSLSFGFQLPENQKSGDLVLEFENLKSEKGKILILLFSSEDGFPEDAGKSRYSANIDPTKSHVIKNIPYGKYALAMVHDEDNNGKMNLNFFGIPKEGYSFSNSKGHGLERPNYKKAEFQHKDTATRVKVRFIY